MIIYRDKLQSVEFQVAEKEYSFVKFDFLYFEESMLELRKREDHVKALCRSILLDIYAMIFILCKYQVAELNIHVPPMIKYGSTLDNKRRFFDITYSLGKIKPDSDPLEMFNLFLSLRKTDGLHSIEYGRFDIEFQALKWCKHHYYLETYIDDKTSSYFNSKLVQLSIPVYNIIQKLLELKFSQVILLSGECQESLHTESTEVLVCEGILIQSPNQDQNFGDADIRNN